MDAAPAEDKNVANLAIVESYCAEIVYGGNEYTIYAYVLTDTDAARVYSERETGKDSASADCNFSEVGNLLFMTRYVAFSENRVVYIEGMGLAQFSALRDYLFANLSMAIG